MKKNLTVIAGLAALGVLDAHSASAALKLKQSYANPTEAVVRHTHLDLTIDFDQRIVSGSAILDVEIFSGNTLMLDSVGLLIKEVVSLDGGSVLSEIERDEKSVQEKLGEPIRVTFVEPRPRARIKITYSSDPSAMGLVWMRPEQTRSGFPFMFAMNEPIGARTWFPCQDDPSVRGTYSADLRIVSKSYKNMMALISGNNNPRQVAESMVYQGLKSEVPIPTYLFVIAAGKFDWRSVSPTVGFYADNDKTMREAQEGLKYTPHYYKALTDLLGMDPWGRHDFLFLPAMFGYGGMENPQLIYINESLVEPTGSGGYVMAHELAHQLTGNVVTNATWGDFWLNEGWTTYFEMRALEAVHDDELKQLGFAAGNALSSYGEWKSFYDDYLKDPSGEIGSQLTQLCKVGQDHLNPDDTTDFSVYGKGMSMLMALESLVGRTTFDAISKRYIQHFWLKPATTAGFYEFMVPELTAADPTVNWRAFLDAWIFKPGMSPQFEDARLSGLGIPKNAGVQEKVDEFAVLQGDTQFSRWNGFQIQYLLRQIQEKFSTDPATAHQWVSALATNPTFRDSALPILEVKGLWYEVLIGAGKWQESGIRAEIETMLKEVGRGRVIKPIYGALNQVQGSSRQAALAFFDEVFEVKKSEYFPPVTDDIEKLVKARASEAKL